MKCLLVDLQGVILLGSRKKYDPWLKSQGANPYKVHKIYHELTWDLHRGIITGAEVVRQINDVLGTNISAIEFFRRRLENPKINHQLIAFIRKLKSKGIRTYLLSDISKPSWDLVRQKYPFLRIFDQKIVSCNTGYRKEESRYYSYLEKRLKCKKQDMLLIDDTKEIITIANKAGLQTVHFKSMNDMKHIK